MSEERPEEPIPDELVEPEEDPMRITEDSEDLIEAVDEERSQDQTGS